MPYTGRENYPYYQEKLAEPSALWSDLYALTMAQALWEDGRHNAQATFHGFIRTAPYDGQYLLTAGQNVVLEWMDKNWKFDDGDIYTLAKKTIPGPDGKEHKLFKP
jgi:nicotinate phosphoribosyltransferase